MNFNHPFFPKHTFLFMGGGGGVTQVQQAPVPTPAPPVTTTTPEVIQAQQDVLQQEMLKKSIKKTIYAGDTGGFKAAGAAPGASVSPMQATSAKPSAYK